MSTRRLPGIASGRIGRQGRAMAGKDQEREARLAAKLRENLKRRKVQARAQDIEPDPALPSDPALPKEPPAG
jgi:hypothetical protein